MGTLPLEIRATANAPMVPTAIPQPPVKVQAMTVIRPQDTPAIWLNEETMTKSRPELKKYYYDPTKYKTYLDQLGIKDPAIR
jgi:hypothetical protein